MSIRRVALIYDSVQRPETTGGYCLRALKRLVDVEHFQPGELDGVPREGFDLYLNIDDGLRYQLPRDLRPSAWWAIDTHLNLAWCVEKSQDFDIVFAAQRDGAEQLRAAGISTAAWLPLACEPEIHAKHIVTKMYDVAFIGNMFPGPRSELLELIGRQNVRSFIGRCYFEDMALAYSAARVVFNRSIRNDVNMRVFEALACGSLLLTNDLTDNGQADMFRDGVHLATYREADDMIDKLRFYLEREPLREEIAAAGRAVVFEKHTYAHRMEQVLRAAENALSKLVVRPALNPGRTGTNVQRLAADFPWPDIRPEVPTPAGPLGWLGDGAATALESELTPATRLVVELGSWLGMSARFMADLAPGATVIAIDHWQGSHEHQEDPGCRDMLPTLYESFLAMNWEYRDRIIPLKMSTIEGLELAKKYELAPDLIYFDADHGYDELLDNLDCALRLFPGAVMVGDDFAQPSVARAVADFAALHDLYVELAGDDWKAWKLVARVAGTDEFRSPHESGGRSTNGIDHHDPVYFGHARPEVMALIPETARAVLDIGCGAGRLGAAIKARQQAEVFGVELDQHAVTAARLCLDEVYCGDIERLDLSLPPGRFDAIVCGDILEHLREPERLVRQAREWLSRDGHLIASIPNVRHHSVVRSLLEGNWTYESAGLLDRTHLRFFTRREVEKLFFRAGFMIEEMRSVVGPGDGEGLRSRQGPMRLGRLCIDGLSEQEVTDYFTYQYLVRARPAASPGHGMTSIVIVTHNQLDYTRQCLDSIRRLTDEPYELIVVDNGSTDGTVQYLRSFSDVRLIVNDANRGFPTAANQGIAVASGSQVLLLNNDVIVTTGWLFRLLRALDSDPTIGLAGPCSNFVSGPQQVDVRYDSLADLDGFAWDWGGANDGRRVDVNRLVGFCLLIRREVIESIGVLDEQFGVGCFEDDDYCLRAIQAGFRAVIAADSFIHHFGGRTFVASGVDFGPLMRENERRFREKWSANEARAADVLPPVDNGSGITSRIDPEHAMERHEDRSHTGAWERGQREVLPDVLHKAAAPVVGATLKRAPGPFAVAMAPGGGLQIRREHDRPRLSLCMIVRDSARTLPACLESIRPWVDEMVIVDTGSVDETPRIVESFGGRLFHFPWCDDFSAARNESLRHARGDWIFWMDSDDTIPPNCGRGLRGLIDGEPAPGVLGYIMQVHCPGGSEDGGPDNDVTMVDHVKLFRNRPGLRFDHRIHEQILPAIRSAGGEVAWTDLYVVHSGSDQTPAGQAKKLERDLRILNLELAERPEHPFTLFNLGMTHCHGSRFLEAVDYLRRGIARAQPGEPHLRKAFALLMFALMRLNRREDAMEACRRGRALFPHDTELRFREGVLLHDLGRFNEARAAYLDALNQGEERHFSSVDRALRGFKARQNLAVLANDIGDLAEAERQWREVVREVPRYRQGWRGLGETLARSSRFAEVESIAAGLLRDDDLCVEGLLMKGRTALTLGRLAEAREALDRAAAVRPDDLETLRGRCQFLFEHGGPDEAEGAFDALIGHAPDDAAAHHNRGTLLMRNRRHDEAVQAYRQSLQHRPNYAATYLNLGYALKDGGRIDEAVAAWEQVLRLSPGDPVAGQELARLGRVGI